MNSRAVRILVHYQNLWKLPMTAGHPKVFSDNIGTFQDDIVIRIVCDFGLSLLPMTLRGFDRD